MCPLIRARHPTRSARARQIMGASLSCALLCMLPAIRCNIGHLQNQFAFHPPHPTYRLTSEGGSPDGSTIKWADGQPPPPPQGVSIHTRFVTSALGNRIAIFHFVREAAEVTLLWSHGNAMDCGECVELLQLMSKQLNVNVVAYDYAGYGASSGSPSEAGTYADITAVHTYLHDAGVQDPQIIVVGQSVGSGPSTWLAERRQGLRGLFLMSGLLSGLRVLSPAPCCSFAGFCAPPFVFMCCDIYPNHRRLQRVGCPVLIMHGTEDEVIDVSHSHELHRLCPAHLRREPHFVEGAGHNDVVEVNPDAYFTIVGRFLQSLR